MTLLTTASSRGRGLGPRLRLAVFAALLALAAACVAPFTAGQPAAAADTYSISGTVSGAPSGGFPPIIQVTNTATGISSWAGAQSDGTFTVSSLPPANYTVLATVQGTASTPTYGGYYGGASADKATPVAVGNADVPGIDIAVTAGVKIAGTVSSATTPAPLANTILHAYRWSGSSYDEVAFSTGWSNYTIGDYQYLPAGQYTVGFTGTWYGTRITNYPYCDQYWNGQPTLAKAGSFTLAAGEKKTGVDATLSTACAPVQRDAGADRFGTSATISAANYSPGVDVAYIANGMNFPDALSGAPVAGSKGGPVLLSQAGALSASVSAELTRLKPKKIVVLGGAGAISAALQTRLATYTTGTVERYAGTDRFDTSATISAKTFAAGVPVAYVANGMNFPDALSGAPAAGAQDGPVLLSQAGALSASVSTELKRLKPQKIVVLGGVGAITSALEAKLAGYTTGSVVRYAGTDRFATSATISAKSFAAGVPVAYIANGMNFPDALSGAPVAGSQGGPVLLTQASALSSSVAAELTRLKPKKIVVLGGTGAVSSALEKSLQAYLGN